MVGTFDLTKSEDTLMDYGYSLNFARTALAKARVQGEWDNLLKTIHIQYVGDGKYQVQVKP